ncbi:MAG TPA: 2-dehydropantoate 2-reductase [Burkholderiaceae bacterium]
MKIAVVGLGAVGGLVAARLALAGHEVSGLARGATLAAVRRGGLRLEVAGQTQRVELRASDDARTLGAQDLVVIALKGQALAEAGASIQPLLGAQTTVLPAMNGVPWWFLQTLPAGSGLDEAARTAPLASIDPDGRIAAALPLARVLGCVVHLTCASPEPGLVRHGFGDRLIVGEPAGGASARTDSVCAALAGAGFTAEPSADIRHDVWYKLWGNMTMNPVSALTGATADRILDDPLVNAFMLRTMSEAAQIGARIGCPIAQSGEERQGLARKLGAFKTSMLQDAQAGRALEIDALVSAVREIGVRVAVPTPNIDALLGLTRLMARERGLYPPAA